MHIMLLTGELKELKEKVKTNSRKELQNLVKENRELSKKLELASGQGGASVGGVKGGASREIASNEGRTLTVEEADDGFERVTISPGRGETLYTMIVYSIYCLYWYQRKQCCIF